MRVWSIQVLDERWEAKVLSCDSMGKVYFNVREGIRTQCNFWWLPNNVKASNCQHGEVSGTGWCVLVSSWHPSAHKQITAALLLNLFTQCCHNLSPCSSPIEPSRPWNLRHDVFYYGFYGMVCCLHRRRALLCRDDSIPAPTLIAQVCRD
jgi:hypothetical protein